MVRRFVRRAAQLTALMLSTGFAVQAAEDTENSSASFAVAEYRVLGNALLSARDIETLLYPLLGDDKTIEDVEKARQALEALYRDHGYGTVFVDIPEQQVAGGVVRLHVTEGKLDRVRIAGARYYSGRQILASVPELQPGSVMHLPSLQTQLQQVNQQSADRRVTPVLRAGRDPGTVDVELRVQDTTPLHMQAGVNNRYSANTSETRLNVTASYDNLFQRYQSLSLQYQTSPEEPSEVRLLAATYAAPLLSSGNVLALYAVDTNSDFAAVGGGSGFDILGAGRIYGARYIVRLPAAAGSAQSLTFGADYKDFKDDIVLTDGVTDTTPITYVGWTAGYGGSWRTERTTTSLNLSANFGLRGVVNDPADFEFKRYKAKANYFYLRGDGQGEQPLVAGTTLFFRAAAQWAPEPLISNEQFAVGGAESVRGYLESSQLADLGMSGSIEVRSPGMQAWLGAWARRSYVALFYDAALVSILEPLANADGQITSSFELASAGVGLRLDTNIGLTGAIDWAYPFKANGDTLKGDSRVLFQVLYGF